MMRKLMIGLIVLVVGQGEALAQVSLDSCRRMAIANNKEIIQQQIKIEQVGNSVVIYGAAGKTVYVYNLIGVKVMSVPVDAAEKKIDLSNLGKGIYPVKAVHCV